MERELRALGNYNLGALSEDVSLTERLRDRKSVV